MLRILRHLLLVGLIVLPLAASAYPFAYLPNSANGTVAVVDLCYQKYASASAACSSPSSLTVGKQPSAALVWGNGLGLMVANSGEEDLSFFPLLHDAPASGTATSVSLPGHPYRLATVPDSSRILVTFSDLHALALVDNNPQTAWQVPPQTSASQTSAYLTPTTPVSLIAAPAVVLVQLDPNVVGGEIVVSSDGNYAYIASQNIPYPNQNPSRGEIIQVNLRTLQVTHTWDIEGIATSMALTLHDTNLFAAVPYAGANSSVGATGEVVNISTGTANGNVSNNQLNSSSHPQSLLVDGSRLYAVMGTSTTGYSVQYWDLTDLNTTALPVTGVVPPSSYESACNTSIDIDLSGAASASVGTVPGIAMSTYYWGQQAGVNSSSSVSLGYLQMLVQEGLTGKSACFWLSGNTTNLDQPPVYGKFLGPYPPSYAFGSASYAALENMSPVTLTAIRLGDTTGASDSGNVVNWATYNLSNKTGYAHAGTHYAASGGSLSYFYGSTTPITEPAVPITNLKWSGPAMSFGVELIASADNGAVALGDAASEAVAFGLQSTTQVQIEYNNNYDPTKAGGCSLARRGAFDPLLPLLIIASAFLCRRKSAAL